MDIIKISNSGETEESKDRPDEKRDPDQDERTRRETPDLQIVEIGHVPEKGTEAPPPWIIQGILDKTEDAGKKNGDLPN